MQNQISLSSISLYKDSPGSTFNAAPYLIKIQTNNNKDLIKLEMCQSKISTEDAKKQHKGIGKYCRSEITIPVKLDQTLTFERVSKAFKHAITLCGGVEEKF